MLGRQPVPRPQLERLDGERLVDIDARLGRTRHVEALARRAIGAVDLLVLVGAVSGLLVGDLDQRGGVARRLPGLGDHQRHRLVGELDLV